MSFQESYSGGTQDSSPARMDSREWRTFGQLETVALRSDVPLEREFRLYGEVPGIDLVAQFKKTTAGRLDLSSIEVDLSVVDHLAPPFSADDIVPLGGASDPAFVEVDVNPGGAEQLERGLMLDGTGQLIFRALGLFSGAYAAIIIRGYARISPPVTGAYFVAGFAANARAQSIAGGIGQAITGSWYQRRASGDPALTLGLAGDITIQTQVAAPVSSPSWEPWTLGISAQRVGRVGDGEAKYHAGGWRGHEAVPPAGDAGLGDNAIELGWDAEDREVMLGAFDAELLVQQISVHSRGL